MSRIEIPWGELAGISIVTIIITLAYLALAIVCIVLFIKLATRGIKALDIYISKNSRPFYPGPQNPYNGPQPPNNPKPQPPNSSGEF